MKPRVLITACAPLDHLQPLDGIAEIVMGPATGALMPRDEVFGLAPELDAIMNHGDVVVDDAFLTRAPRLKIVANMAVGFNNLNLEAMTCHGVWATNAPEPFIDATADSTIGLLLAVARRICEGHTYVQAGHWPKEGFRPTQWDGWRLRDKVLGIVGYGRIGRAVAKRAEAFGMKIQVYGRTCRNEPNFCDLDQLLATSDVISLHVPLTPQTRHLLNGNNLPRMKPGAILVNVSRGPVIEEDALCRILAGGQLGGAALDVVEFEPQVSEALLGRKNVVITPHLGGCSLDGRRESRLQSAASVAAVLAGQTPANALNHPIPVPKRQSVL